MVWPRPNATNDEANKWGRPCLWGARSVKKTHKKHTPKNHTQYLNLGAYHLQINIANIDTYATIVKLE